MSGTGEDSAVLGVERVDMSGASEPFGARIRIGQGANRRGAVVCRHTGGASFEQVDRYGEGRAENRRVALHLVFQLELAATLLCDGCAEDTATLLEHEVDFLRRDEFGGRNQVAFVFAILIIDDNDEFSGFEVLKGFFYRGKLNFRHEIYLEKCLCRSVIYGLRRSGASGISIESWHLSAAHRRLAIPHRETFRQRPHRDD